MFSSDKPPFWMTPGFRCFTSSQFINGISILKWSYVSTIFLRPYFVGISPQDIALKHRPTINGRYLKSYHYIDKPSYPIDIQCNRYFIDIPEIFQSISSFLSWPMTIVIVYIDPNILTMVYLYLSIYLSIYIYISINNETWSFPWSSPCFTTPPVSQRVSPHRDSRASPGSLAMAAVIRVVRQKTIPQLSG